MPTQIGIDRKAIAKGHQYSTLVCDLEQATVFDRFHIMRHIVEAVDKLGKQEHEALMDKRHTTLVKSQYLG